MPHIVEWLTSFVLHFINGLNLKYTLTASAFESLLRIVAIHTNCTYLFTISFAFETFFLPFLQTNTPWPQYTSRTGSPLSAVLFAASCSFKKNPSSNVADSCIYSIILNMHTLNIISQ